MNFLILLATLQSLHIHGSQKFCDKLLDQLISVHVDTMFNEYNSSHGVKPSEVLMEEKKFYKSCLKKKKD